MKPSTARRRPVVIDLFSGAGGLSLGFESAGYDVVSAVEYDPVHAAVHLFNFPLTDVLCRDITTVTKEELLDSAARGFALHNPGERWDGIVDAVVGGPSCQGFSTMGKQDADDDRNQLVLQFVRAVEEIRPRAFCMENVPGLLDTRFDNLRNTALKRLRAAGYAISGDNEVLKAENYGVPQKRRRVFILGSLAEVAPPRPAPLTDISFSVSDAFAGLPDALQQRGRIEGDILPLTGAEISSVTGALNQYLQLAGIVDTGAGGNLAFGHARYSDKSRLSGCRVTVHSNETIQRFLQTAPGTKEKVSRLYKLAADAPALTLRAGTGRERGAFSAARPLHPIHPRVVTIREAARLHTFPDWFRFHTTNWHGHRQIGNSVPPLLARAAAMAILHSLGIRPVESSRAAISPGDESLLTLSPTAAAKFFQASDDQVPKRRREAPIGDGKKVEVAA